MFSCQSSPASGNSFPSQGVPCTGRSYFTESMKLLFLAEKKQLLSRQTKLARLCSALLWTDSSQIASMHCLGSLMLVRMAGDHSSTQWSEAQNFVLSYTLTVFDSTHSSHIISVQGVGVCSKLCFRTRLRLIPCFFWNGDNVFHNAERSICTKVTLTAVLLVHLCKLLDVHWPRRTMNWCKTGTNFLR